MLTFYASFKNLCASTTFWYILLSYKYIKIVAKGLGHCKRFINCWTWKLWTWKIWTWKESTWKSIVHTNYVHTYSNHSINHTDSIKQPGLEFSIFQTISSKCTVKSENWRPKHLIVLSLLNDLVCGLRLTWANLSKIFATFPSYLTVSGYYLLISSTFKWLVFLKSSLN